MEGDQKQQRWCTFCEDLHPHESNTYVWKVLKNIDNIQEQEVTSNTFHKDAIPILEDHKAVNVFADHYSKVSNLEFDRNDKSTELEARKIKALQSIDEVHIMNSHFKMYELENALLLLDAKKCSWSRWTIWLYVYQST